MLETILSNVQAWQIGIAVSVVMMILAKTLPNKKLYNWGFWVGNLLTVFGTVKLGKPWQKFEDFILNSVGAFYEGFSAGLKSDNE